MTTVPFGWLIRSIHRWSADIFIGVLAVHLFTAYLMKAYRRPRELTWLTGVALFGVALTFGFSGYLLPWDEIAFWPLPERPPSIVEGYTGLFRPLVFSPDSRSLATVWPDGSLRLWPLPGGRQEELRVLHQGDLSEIINNLTFDAAGERLVGTGGSGLFVSRLRGGPLQRLEGFSQDQLIFDAGFSPSGTFVAAGTGYGPGSLSLG